MSFDLFVQRFRDGDEGPPMEAETFRAVFGAYLDGSTDGDYHHLVATDGGTADIYATLSPDFTSLMVTHFSTGRVLDLVVEFARAADAVIVPVDCPTCVTHEGQLRHLPDELRADARLVVDGAGLEAAIGEA